MNISNSSSKENANVESKNENESGIQGESQKFENIIDVLFNIRKNHSNKIIMANIKINSFSETKLHSTFPHALYHMKDFSNPYRLERNSYGGKILVNIRDNIPSNLLKLDLKFGNFEGFFNELPLSKKSKWLLRCLYNQHNGNTSKWLLSYAYNQHNGNTCNTI